MRHPNIVNAYRFWGDREPPVARLPGADLYVPARAEGYASFWHRFRCAWLVFTGRADALIWPGQGCGNLTTLGRLPAAPDGEGG